jgi:hypothetical protein
MPGVNDGKEEEGDPGTHADRDSGYNGGDKLVRNSSTTVPFNSNLFAGDTEENAIDDRHINGYGHEPNSRVDMASNQPISSISPPLGRSEISRNLIDPRLLAATSILGESINSVDSTNESFPMANMASSQAGRTNQGGLAIRTQRQQRTTISPYNRTTTVNSRDTLRARIQDIQEIRSELQPSAEFKATCQALQDRHGDYANMIAQGLAGIVGIGDELELEVNRDESRACG